MSAYNMPPGVRESDIPGNSLAEKHWDDFVEWAYGELRDLDSIDDARLAVEIGCRFIESERKHIAKSIEAGVKERLFQMENDAADAAQEEIERDAWLGKVSP